MSDNFLVYNLASQAHAAADEIWTMSCGPGVRDSPAEVTRRWAIPRQRNIGGWVIEAHPFVTPVANPPLATEAFDPEWFTPLGQWNPNDKSPGITLSVDGREATGNVLNDWASARAQRGRSSGKYYFECVHTVLGNHGNPFVGIADLLDLQLADGTTIGNTLNQFGLNGNTVYWAGITADMVIGLGDTAWSYTAGGIAGFAVDLDARKLWVALNNIYLGLGNPAAGSNWFAHWDAPLMNLYPATSIYNAGVGVDTVRYCGDASDQNFAPPAGFTAWDLE